jgi:hypothetical protein
MCVSLDSCVSHLLYDRDRLLICWLLDAVDSMQHLLKGHLNKFYSYCYIQLFSLFEFPFRIIIIPNHDILETWMYSTMHRFQFPL